MGLLSPGQQWANGHSMTIDEETDNSQDERKVAGPMSLRDRYAVALLVVLCEPTPHFIHSNISLTPIIDLIQGVPIGLAFGSIPFLLKSKLSYSQLGTFSLAT